MHAHPSLVSGSTPREVRRPAHGAVASPPSTERRLLEILDVVLIAFLLAPFLLS